MRGCVQLRRTWELEPFGTSCSDPSTEDSGSSQTMALPPLYPALGPAMGVEGSLHLSILHSPNPEPHGHVVHTQVTGAQS